MATLRDPSGTSEAVARDRLRTAYTPSTVSVGLPLPPMSDFAPAMRVSNGIGLAVLDGFPLPVLEDVQSTA